MSKVIFVCNVFEESTRLQRNIKSDSPAASKKVFDMALALKSVGIRSTILSMGRGAPNRNNSFFKSEVLFNEGIPIIYAPFSHNYLVTYLISFFSMPYILSKLKSSNEKKTIIFYNRTSAYISSLVLSTILGFNRILDLEDTELISYQKNIFYKFFLKLKKNIFNKLCSGGTIMACSAMKSDIGSKTGICYYGVQTNFRLNDTFKNHPKIKILFCGTITNDTGSDILVKAIQLIRQKQEPWSKNIQFVITGKGSEIPTLEKLASEKVNPRIKVTGRLTNSEYRNTLESCDVGLALKPNLGSLANTTFPSKVIEFAGSSLLVLTTDISDVKLILKNSALYLENDDPEELVNRIEWIINNREKSIEMAKKGNFLIRQQCSMKTGGKKLANYIFMDSK